MGGVWLLPRDEYYIIYILDFLKLKLRHGLNCKKTQEVERENITFTVNIKNSWFFPTVKNNGKFS